MGLGQKIDKLQSEMLISEQNYAQMQGIRVRRQNQYEQSQYVQSHFLTWVKCDQIGDVPEARDSHSSCIVNDKIFIYGG